MIYIIKHKEYNNPVPKDYKELYVGKNHLEQGDYDINFLNPYINEATGLYEIWKCFKDHIVGLCHYRRYFYYEGDLLTLNQAKSILNDYDMIVTKPVVFDKGIYEQLRSEIENPDVLDKYYNKLCDIEPGLKEWFELKSFSPKEMFVCKRELLNKYCEWLFPIIVPITQEFIKEDVNKVVNKRMIGHLVERLFAYWIYKEELNTYEMEYIDL